MLLCMYQYVCFVCNLLVMDLYLSSLTVFFPLFFVSFFLPYILMIVLEEGIKAYVHFFEKEKNLAGESHSNFIHNSQNSEILQMSISWYMDT